MRRIDVPARPVAWILGMKGLSAEEKDAVLWKNLAGLIGL
jgi:hypothetical protein